MDKRIITSELRDKLFAVIRVALNNENIHINLTEEDYIDLIRIAKQHSIQQIICRGLKLLGVSSEYLSNSEIDCLKDTRLFILQNDSLNNIAIALEKTNIPYIPLKGAILRKLYPEPELRTSSDIDVLVMESNLENAVQAIETYTDFKLRKRKYHDVSMVNGSVHLELHFNLKENIESIDILLSRAWDYAVQSDGCRYVLTPEFQIFHVVAHMSYHMVHGGLGIRPFLDLWLLRNRTNYNEETVQNMCIKCNIFKFYEMCCKLVNFWMSDLPLSEDLIAFEAYALNGGVFGNKENARAYKQREHRGYNYYFHRIFLSRKQLEIFYPALIGKPYMLPVYQLRRWFSLFNKERRKQLKSEMEIMSSMNSETIDSFDRLLSQLGL